MAGCAVVASIGARGGLDGHGLEFIPAIVPFLLVPFTLPSVVRIGRAAQPLADLEAA